MKTDPQTEAAIRKVLADWGLDAPTAAPPHGWRCQYPKLSDPATCGHVDRLVANIMVAVSDARTDVAELEFVKSIKP